VFFFQDLQKTLQGWKVYVSLCYIDILLRMIEHFTLEGFWFPFFYVGTSVTALYAGIYLLFRKGNAFEPKIQPPVRLRRWAAVFMISIALSHLWWKLFYFDFIVHDATPKTELCLLFDVLTCLPAMLFSLHAMLQDCKRPSWPILFSIVLAVVEVCLYFFFKDNSITAIAVIFCIMMLYILVPTLLFVRQYQRWLRENYADLEHKEVLSCVAVIFVFILATIVYNFFILDNPYNIYIELVDTVLIILLLWRVESIQTLEEPEISPHEVVSEPVGVFAKIDLLLQKHCVEEQYYLRHDMSLSQLSKLIGTNNTYLSQYFSKKGQSYNTYINGLRVQHFIRLYEDALATGRIFTAGQLAYESGFQSYSTFGEAFKQAKGQTVTAWMRSRESM